MAPARSSGCTSCPHGEARASRRLLHAIEDRARGLGYRVLRLDTGPRQAGAQRLYESEGYVEVANFNGNPVASFFGEKRVGPGPTPA